MSNLYRRNSFNMLKLYRAKVPRGNSLSIKLPYSKISKYLNKHM